MSVERRCRFCRFRSGDIPSLIEHYRDRHGEGSSEIVDLEREQLVERMEAAVERFEQTVARIPCWACGGGGILYPHLGSLGERCGVCRGSGHM